MTDEPEFTVNPALHPVREWRMTADSSSNELVRTEAIMLIADLPHNIRTVLEVLANTNIPQSAAQLAREAVISDESQVEAALIRANRLAEAFGYAPMIDYEKGSWTVGSHAKEVILDVLPTINNQEWMRRHPS